MHGQGCSVQLHVRGLAGIRSFRQQGCLDEETLTEYSENYGRSLSEEEVRSMMYDAIADNFKEACANLDCTVPGKIAALGLTQSDCMMLGDNLSEILTMCEEKADETGYCVVYGAEDDIYVTFGADGQESS